MAKKPRNHLIEEADIEFHTGAVEDDPEAEAQILPVWASSEPFGYEGSPADTQLVGGGDGEAFEAEEAHSRRDIIGPGA